MRIKVDHELTVHFNHVVHNGADGRTQQVGVSCWAASAQPTNQQHSLVGPSDHQCSAVVTFSGQSRSQHHLPTVVWTTQSRPQHHLPTALRTSTLTPGRRQSLLSHTLNTTVAVPTHSANHSKSHTALRRPWRGRAGPRCRCSRRPSRRSRRRCLACRWRRWVPVVGASCGRAR